MGEETPKDEWQTPAWVWKPWDARLMFQLDGAANAANVIKPGMAFITKEQNSLETNWASVVPKGSSCWLNPPYSQAAGGLEAWLLKVWSEMLENRMRVVCLLQLDTSTKWWDLVWDRRKNTWQEGIIGYYLPRRVRHIDPATGKASGGTPKFASIITYHDSRIIYPADYVGSKAISEKMKQLEQNIL